MDSLTHLALGGVIGEALAGKKLGKRAIVYGALANSLPDIDFVAAFWLPTSDNLLAHRGFTHSILFAVLASVFLGLLAKRWHGQYALSLSKWTGFFAIEIFSHLFIDAFNAYGIGWFEPFNHYRVSFNTIFVADPFYSIWPAIAVVALLLVKSNSWARKYWIAFGLAFSSTYLVYCIFNKYTINRDVKESLSRNEIVYSRYFTTPTPLNNWLWYIVAEDDRGYHIGYRSVFDTGTTDHFQYFYREEKLVQPFHDQEELQHLIRFSKGYYTAEVWGDTLVFNDLRFGQIVGWYDPKERFVFHYFLQSPNDNALVIQRGRFAKWNKETINALIKRIEGE